MHDDDWLAARFGENRERLRAVAYRMLGSLAEADDALQDAWVRVQRAGADEVENLGGWLTTIVARVCLNMLRARAVRCEDALVPELPDPIVTTERAGGPEDQAVLADSVGLALQVVLDTLGPDERLAFVLHDMFGLPFEEIAAMLDRSAEATRQLASRARRRVRGADISAPEADVGRQRAVVDAFFAAARGGDLGALVAVLHPDVVLRVDFGASRRAASSVIRGAEAVAAQAKLGAAPASELHAVLVNGTAGAVVTRKGQAYALMAFTVADGAITEIDIIVEPDRVRRLAGATLVEGEIPARGAVRD